MTRIELAIRRWVFSLGHRLLHVDQTKIRTRCGHWLCGLASGIKVCCIRYFLSDELKQETANIYKKDPTYLELLELDSQLYGRNGRPEFGYAPCPKHRHANLYPIKTGLYSRNVEELLSAWQRDFLKRVFKEP